MFYIKIQSFFYKILKGFWFSKILTTQIVFSKKKWVERYIVPLKYKTFWNLAGLKIPKYEIVDLFVFKFKYFQKFIFSSFQDIWIFFSKNNGRISKIMADLLWKALGPIIFWTFLVQVPSIFYTKISMILQKYCETCD